MAFFKQLMESQPQPQLQPQPQPQLQLQTQQQPQLQLQPQQRLMAQVPDELHCDASAAANTSLAVGHSSRPAPGWPQAVGSWPGSLTSPPTQHQPSQQQPFQLQQQPVLQLSGASNAGTQQQLHSLLQQLRRSTQEKPARNDRNPPKPGTVAALLGRAPSLRDSVASQIQFGPSGRSGFTPPGSACRTTVNNGARVFQTNGITPAHVEPCADDGLEAGGRAGDDSGAGEEGSATGIYKQRRRGNAGRDEQETNGEGDMLSSDRHQRGSFQRRINKSMLQEVYHLPIQEAAQHLRMGVTVLKKYCRSFKVERWPFRKLQSLDKLIQSVQEQQAMEPSIDLTFTLSELQRFKAEVYDTPEVALDERIKRLRQANFKQVGGQAGR
ncbi:RWP-RK domain-containing protein [Haematococcus lacustris]